MISATLSLLLSRQYLQPKRLIPMLLPIVIPLVPLVCRKQSVRVVAAVLMGGFSLIAMSVGLIFLPAAIMMVLAACSPDTTQLRDAVR